MTVKANSLPYTPVEYIVTDGSCYIRPGTNGITGTPPRSSEIKVLMGSNTACSLLASFLKSSGTDSKQFALARYNVYKYATYSYYSNYGSNDVTTSVAYSIDNNKPFIVKTDLKKGSQHISVKQENSDEWTTTTKTSTNRVSSTYALVIFGAYRNSRYEDLAPSGTRLYYCKIYSDETYTTLVFDGVPCLYNGAYGLWDKVSDSFFGNKASSGAFTGPAI